MDLATLKSSAICAVACSRRWWTSIRCFSCALDSLGFLPRSRPELEVGYHVGTEMQGRGYATEAAAACRDYARDALKAVHLVAITHPDNTASRRVAEKIGLEFEEDDHGGAIDVRSVYGLRL